MLWKYTAPSHLCSGPQASPDEFVSFIKALDAHKVLDTARKSLKVLTECMPSSSGSVVCPSVPPSQAARELHCLVVAAFISCLPLYPLHCTLLHSALGPINGAFFYFFPRRGAQPGGSIDPPPPKTDHPGSMTVSSLRVVLLSDPRPEACPFEVFETLTWKFAFRKFREVDLKCDIKT